MVASYLNSFSLFKNEAGFFLKGPLTRVLEIATDAPSDEEHVEPAIGADKVVAGGIGEASDRAGRGRGRGGHLPHLVTSWRGLSIG